MALSAKCWGLLPASTSIDFPDMMGWDCIRKFFYTKFLRFFSVGSKAFHPQDTECLKFTVLDLLVHLVNLKTLISKV